MRAALGVTVAPATNQPLLDLLGEIEPTPIPSTVGLTEIEQGRTAAREFSSWDHTYGGGVVREDVSAQLRYAVNLLGAGCAERHRTDLHSAVGFLGHTAGFMAFDAYAPSDARSMFQLGLTCAEAAGDWHLRGNVLSSMARQAIWCGHPDDGLTFIELAMVRADRLTATERAMLHAARARALAKLHRTEEAVRSVGQADEEFAHASPGNDPPWMAYYDAAQHSGDTGHALFDVALDGQFVGEARHRLEAAVAGHTAAFVRSRAISGIKLASLTMATGDPVEAASLARQRWLMPDICVPVVPPMISASFVCSPNRTSAPPRWRSCTPDRPNFGSRMSKAIGTDWLTIVRAAGAAVGLDVDPAEPIKVSENAIYRLPGHVVARVSRPGQLAAACREVNVARWLTASGVPAVQAVPKVDQPVEVDGRAVTFWRELPPHQHGTPAQVAGALKQLRRLSPPADLALGDVAPFVRLEERIEAAHSLSDEDRQWLRIHLAELQQRWRELPKGLPWCVIHGEAWVGNVAATDDGRVILLDLERTSTGPPEWDLVHITIKWKSFGWITEGQYAEFCDVYGHDVAKWAGFELLRDIREFRMTTMAGQAASANPAFEEQARHRLACIRGDYGIRPWSGWKALE